MHTIDHMMKTKMATEQFDVLKTKFKNMRTAGLQRFGEFSRENLVFKELRNRGYIDKMNKYEASLKDKELSLK
jgi:tRNA splicing endonuclease